MIVIGLVGGMTKNRDEIAAKLVAQDKKRISTFVPGGTARSERRAKQLRAFIGKHHGERNGEAIILPHTLTLEEALHVREIGGYLWHLQGDISTVIPSKKGDLYVTKEAGGNAQYLDPEEAFHQSVINHKARAVAA